jgi:mono/diheme cytochrome c family protein
MNKFLKILGVLVLILVVVVAGAITYARVALPDVGPPPELVVEVTPERLERGEYLAHHVMLCMDCHSTRDWNQFTAPPIPGTEGVGGELFDQSMGFPGKFFSRNITPHGLGNWSDGEIYRAITTGVSKDGSPLFPVMPYLSYGRMDDEDIHSVIAYLRSLPAVASSPEHSEADFPMNIIMRTIPQKGSPGKIPPPTAATEYGAYLVNAAACNDCHTNQVEGKVVGEPFAGGFEFQFPAGILRSVNITPHPTGIGNWSRDQFIARFKMHADSSFTPHAVDMLGGDFQTIMPWMMYAGMTETDLGAIYDYLRTLKPVDSVVERWTPSKPS